MKYLKFFHGQVLGRENSNYHIVLSHGCIVQVHYPGYSNKPGLPVTLVVQLPSSSEAYK